MKTKRQYRIYLCKDTYYKNDFSEKVSTEMEYMGTVIAESEYQAVKRYCDKNNVKKFEQYKLNEYEIVHAGYIGMKQKKKR